MRRLLYFSRSQRKSVVILAVLMLIILGLFCLFHHSKTSQPDLCSLDTSQEMKDFCKSIEQEKGKIYGKRIPLRLHAFNPNYCDSITLLELGLKPWQARIFLHYRNAGAVFRSVNDLKRVYSFSQEDFQRIAPYATFNNVPHDRFYAKHSKWYSKNDSLHHAKHPFYGRSEKLKEGETVDIASADTTQLKRIPGIGSYYAKQICKYRDKLGGYISTAQLKEIPDFPTAAIKWFTISSQPLRRLNANSDNFKQLVHHPYLNYEQTKAIFNHRRLFGKLTSVWQLSTEPAFTKADLVRLEPYLYFE